jgi:hypothetical protein
VHEAPDPEPTPAAEVEAPPPAAAPAPVPVPPVQTLPPDPHVVVVQTAAPAQTQAAPPPLPILQVPVVAEECEIAYWRGYRKSKFYARGFDADGVEVALAESRSFRVEGSRSPERTEEAAAAYDQLVEQLTEDGWRPVDEDDRRTWFAQSFERVRRR